MVVWMGDQEEKEKEVTEGCQKLLEGDGYIHI